ncbi:glycosyltransferase family 2 protein [Candidatus Fermentibacteria bacterium]|nr:glycosyltransferase family 2 protein [Candidatus Fermentibacteria bacterium]
METDGILLSIVVPAFNEAESIPDLVAETAAALSGRDWEMIIVDDGSTDSTWDEIRRAASSHPVAGLRFGRNHGKAAALSAGFAAARGAIIATMDADLQDDPAEIPAMADLLAESGLGVLSGWKRERRDPPSKRLPSRFFNAVVRRFTGIPLHDFNCGLKVYRAEPARRIDLYGEMHRYTPVLVSQLGWAVGEKPVNHRPRRHGHSKYGPARFFRGYADLLTVLFLHRYSFRPLHFFGGIGTTLFAGGLGISLYLTLLKILTGASIGRRPLLLLGVFLMMIGFQFVSLGLLGEMQLRLLPGKRLYTVVETAGRLSGTGT